MTILAIVLGSIAAYLAIGAVYARSQSVAITRRAKSEWSTPSIVTMTINDAIALRVFLWPFVMPYDAFHVGLRGWLTAPVQNRQSKAAQLRADARHWRSVMATGSEQEREMAETLARMCEDRANEFEL